MQDGDAGELGEPPTRSQLCVAAAALVALARARGAAEGVQLEVVAAWLRRIAAPSRRSRGQSGCCECGAALAHVAGAGVVAVLCTGCDAERLDELGDGDMASETAAPEPGPATLASELCLSLELAQLGREAARDAWAEACGDAGAIPRFPELRAWGKLGADLGLFEADRPLTEPEQRVFVDAYRNELRALAGGAP